MKNLFIWTTRIFISIAVIAGALFPWLALNEAANAGSGTTGILGQASRGQVVQITPQSHPSNLVNNYSYSFLDLQGASNCWYLYGQDQRCDLKHLRFPAYTGTAPLREVRLYLRWHISYSGKFENLSLNHSWNDPNNPNWINPISGIPWGVTWYTWSWSNFENGGMVPLTALPSISIDDCFLGMITAFDGNLDYQGSSGRTMISDWDQCLQPNYWTESVNVLQHPIYTQQFMDPDGVVELTFKSGAFLQIEHPMGEAGVPHEYRTYWDLSLDKIEYLTY